MTAAPGGPAAALRRHASVLSMGASALLAVVILLLPWYALGEYVPNGWDATFWLRVAVVLVILGILRVRGGGPPSVPLAATVLALVAFRVALPPDFGFDFDGLEVPVERRAGAYAGLALASVALVAALADSPGRRAGPRPGARGGGW